MFVWSYAGYTITYDNGKYWITYPNEVDPSIYCDSMDKAVEFINGMVEGDR